MKKRMIIFLPLIMIGLFIFKSGLIYDGINCLAPYIYNLQDLVGDDSNVDEKGVKIINEDGKEITENRIDINTGEKINLEKEMSKVKDISLLDEKDISKMPLEEASSSVYIQIF